uniref:C-type lectin domain-containing protein n=1 Tax=Panagrolaimus davidi TaxID=227884 RepID=A0A914P586_9BILA
MFVQEKGTVNFTDSASSDFWIGLNAVENFRVWTWTDGTPFDFSDWDNGQPKNTYQLWSSIFGKCAEEDLFVANFANYPGADACVASKQGWIGLFTEDNNTHWKWTDGTPTDYLYWYPTNPLGPGSNNCVYMHLAPICGGKIGMFANGGGTVIDKT